MIGIKLQGEDDFLDVPPNTSISLKFENPLLSESDKLSPGSYSLPFDLPGGDTSPKNSRQLKNPDVLENNEAYAIQNATLSYWGVPLRSGTIKAQSTRENKISANFLFGLSQISPEFKTARLRDVIFEAININTPVLTKKIFLKRIVAGDWSLTTNGKNYTAATAAALAALINADADAALDTGKYMPLATVVTVGSTPSGLIAATYIELKLSIYYTYYDPVLLMNLLLRQDSTNINHELHVTTDSPVNYLAESVDLDAYYDAFDTFMAGYISGAYPHAAIRFPVRFNADAYGESGIKDGEVINGITGAAPTRNDPNWGQTHNAPFVVKNYNSLQPFIRLKWVLEKIATYFNFQLEGDFYNHPDLTDLLLDNTASLDMPQRYLGDKKFVWWKTAFNLSELVPDLTVVDFLSVIKSRYNLSIDYNEATLKVRLKFREVIARSNTYVDITPLCSPVRSSDDERITGYTLRQPKESKDLLSVEQTHVVGISEEEIILRCGSINTSNITTINGIPVIGPRVSMKNGDDVGARVFMYRGIVSGIPQASVEDIDGMLTLTDLHTAYWQYWMHFKTKRRTVKVDVSFPFRSLRNFLWEEKYRFNRLNYLVKSIDVKLTNRGVTVSDVELITMS